MRIAITDANIFIDLFYLNQVQFVFNIGFEVYTTNLVLDELEEKQAQQLIQFMKQGLLIIEKVDDEDFKNMQLLRLNRGLSETDISVLCIAEKYNALVITSDDLIRKACKRNAIEVHGVLWCLDQFVKHEILSKKEACTSLIKLMQFNRWLPREACRKYIEDHWKGTLHEQ